MNDGASVVTLNPVSPNTISMNICRQYCLQKELTNRPERRKERRPHRSISEACCGYVVKEDIAYREGSSIGMPRTSPMYCASCSVGSTDVA